MTRLINLDNVPLPKAVETLSIQGLLDESIAEINRMDNSFSEALQSEGEPVRILLQAMAYREFLIRQRINDSAEAVFLATATGTDLDNLAAFWGLQRRTVTSGSTMRLENDSDFRTRVVQSSAALSVAGSQSSYEALATASNDLIFRSSARRTAPGAVTVTLLPYIDQESSVITSEIQSQVLQYLQERSPMTDTITVEVASIVDVQVTAAITLYAGPDSGAVETQIKANLQNLAQDRYAIGQSLPANIIIGSMYIQGVTNTITLSAPATDTSASVSQAIKLDADAATLTFTVAP